MKFGQIFNRNLLQIDALLHGQAQKVFGHPRLSGLSNPFGRPGLIFEPSHMGGPVPCGAGTGAGICRPSAQVLTSGPTTYVFLI